LAESTRLLAIASRAHLNFCGFLQDTGEMREAISHVMRAYELALEMGIYAWAHSFLGEAVYLSIELADFGKAEKDLEELTRLQSIVNDPGEAQIYSRFMKTRLDYYHGRLEEAVQSYQALLTEIRQRSNYKHFIWVYFQAAEALIDLNQLDKGQKAAEEALQMVREEPHAGLALPLSLLASVAIRKNDFITAKNLLEEARVGVRPLYPRETCIVDWTESKLAIVERRWGNAFQNLEKVLEFMHKAGFRWYEARLLTEWAEAKTSRAEPGDLPKAKELLQQALEIYNQIETPFFAEKVREKLDALK
jgi:tetratricopeptide (TPR) repeat protein